MTVTRSFSAGRRAADLPIPGPKQLPVLGNLLDVTMMKTPTFIELLDDLHKEHGGIFALKVGGTRTIFASSHELVHEMCSDPRWSKHIHGALEEIRAFAGDGLFTAHNEEQNWSKAHKMLMPAFGPMAMRDYFPAMLEIADQMFTKWARFGDAAVVDVADDMTRLTLDTIALSAFDMRFNSFYAREMHPFVGAMVRGLVEASARGDRFPVLRPLYLAANRRFERDISAMRKITEEIVLQRLASPPASRPDDLLQRMLSAEDPVTGDKLSEENIQYQLTTFLIAGHETTSGLLSFATYDLLTNPDVLAKAREVVDTVLGDRTPEFEDLADLGYIGQVLRETLRLNPSAPAIALAPSEAAELGGHRIEAGEGVMIVLASLHRDPSVWPDPLRFDPERFAPARMNDIAEHSWMPFGRGERACIGRPFALQEATLVLAMMLQRFDIELADPDYVFEIKETLTIKPKDLVIRARARRSFTSISTAAAPHSAGEPQDARTVDQPGHGTPMLVLYGSNSGGSEGLASTIANEGGSRGWNTLLAPLDDYVDRLPTVGPVVIVTASYNGTPPDNAGRFVQWLSKDEPDLSGVEYLVLGCGSRDWPATYQRIPTVIDDAMAAAGARRIRERGATDSRTDFFGDWERWYQPFWPGVSAEYGVDGTSQNAPLFTIEEVETSDADPSPSTVEVRENFELDKGPTGKSKRHLELQIPASMPYRTGDYLSVWPEGHPSGVSRLIARLQIRASKVVRVSSERPDARLPLGLALRVDDLLTRYVELSVPATAGVVARIAETTRCPPERDELERLAGADHTEQVFEKGLTVIDILERFQSCEVDLAFVLELLPRPRARQYSISSAGYEHDTLSLTVSVLEGPAHSGSGTFHGAGSTYLARAVEGSKITAALTHPSDAFRLPEDNATDVVMIAAGSGMAPFRGFIRERVARAKAGETPGRTVLFFGCDHPDWDDLYADEYAEYTGSGYLEIHHAYSRLPDPAGVRFVQHKLWAERDLVLPMIEGGARVYLCGDAVRLAPEVETTLIAIKDNHVGQSGTGHAWLADLREAGRYATDVF